MQAALEAGLEVAGHGRAALDEPGAQRGGQRGAVAGAVEQGDQPAAELVLDAHAGVAQVGHRLAGGGLVARERADLAGARPGTWSARGGWTCRATRLAA